MPCTVVVPTPTAHVVLLDLGLELAALGLGLAVAYPDQDALVERGPEVLVDLEMEN